MAPSAADQTYATHAQWLVPWHFIAFPVLAINVIVAAVALFKNPAMTTVWLLLVAIALVLTVFTARTMVTTVQDRLIRLEELIRLNQLMPGREADVAKLSLAQLVGLRFASDGEAPGLVESVLAGDLSDQKDIKKAVKVWRGDTLRV
jgi:hypothetical protein